MPKSLADWLTHLESLHPKTIALGLERVAQVKQRLDLEPDFPVIVVGGTNGKGSVCAMLESILHAAGYKVGCYTSPHLLRYNERVRIAKQQASDAELCASFEAIELARKGRQDSGDSSHTPTLSQRERGQSQEALDIPLTYFEFGTLAAMQCFMAHKVDVAILEVGLGGRLDAVNVFDADCALVTSVDIDHVDYLGDTREQIAFEKAGIFRAGKVAICADSDVPPALRAHAQQIGAELWCIGSEFGLRAHQGQWDYFGKSGKRSALPYPALRGAFQLQNASAVLAALDVLKSELPVGMEAVRRGLVEVELAGRFQFVPGKPQWILDVAHNPQAARSLAQNLENLPPAKTFALFAMLKDKDMAGVVQALDAQIDVWLVATIDAPRGAQAQELAQVLREFPVRGEVIVCGCIENALNEASKRAGENDRIAALGSFYTVAEVMHLRKVRVI
ncbi:MAG: bifunctional folylpolyglutamate synthase/dihydrofolate synthase [Gammaproteobacteria bacterium]|nr:bifunctional folylpolyglutamate synthase/dihydrofolate synthase [Gammaproteobacteria bacterium]MDD2929431.1 bifunctional folylpolyglutamate synthase/dihydrofolate synthase [Sideroxydans sp.]MDD5471255.1 bifunctional folylpolyglutamate synthase/dihydrofolate synthase [Sideroxydans sp.]